MPEPDILRLIYNSCDPSKPATDAQYVDCSDARGDDSFVDYFQNELRLADDFLVTLFTGHPGCGKSSELRQLERQLERQLRSPRTPGARPYFPVLIDSEEFLDPEDASFTDVILMIAAGLGEALSRSAVQLDENVFRRVFGSVVQFFGELSVDEVKAGGNWGWGNASVGLKRLKKDPTARQQVRSVLVNRTTNLLEELNILFEEVRQRLHDLVHPAQDESWADLVLIIDNLEKIRRIEREDEGIDSHRKLFVERSASLAGLRAHVIYTVPLALVRSTDGPVLKDRYGLVYVLPMIKISERDGVTRYEKGCQRLRDILRQRLDGLGFEQAFEEDALEFMLQYSGGHVRSLMRFAQAAATYASAAPITRTVAIKAVGQTASTYSTSVPEAHWDKLATLDASTDQKIPSDDTDFAVMIENLTVLEYRNGEQSAGLFADREPWYAVNPVVKELQKFKESRARVRQG